MKNTSEKTFEFPLITRVKPGLLAIDIIPMKIPPASPLFFLEPFYIKNDKVNKFKKSFKEYFINETN